MVVRPNPPITNSPNPENAEGPPREPRFEVTLIVMCKSCLQEIGRFVRSTDADGSVSVDEPPATVCPTCGCDEFLADWSNLRVLNPEDFDSNTGWKTRVKAEGQKKPILETQSYEQVYSETGDRVFYERVYNRDQDLYFKRYTNLETGEVVVEEAGTLKAHQG